MSGNWPAIQVSSRGIRIFSFVISSCLILTACSGLQQKKVFVIGIANPAEILDPIIEGFIAEMAVSGYLEGENILYLYEGAVDRSELDRVMEDLLSADVGMIIAMTTSAAQAAKKATADTGTPVVFEATNPLGAGLVDNLRQPGGNLTGIITGGSDPLRLEWLLRIAPDAKRVYLPYNSADNSPAGVMPQIREAADQLGIELILREVHDADAVRNAIAEIPEQADAIFIGPDSLVGSLYPEWISAAISRKLPLTGSSNSHVKAGMLFSYSYEAVAIGRQMARLAIQIMEGAAPGELPIETSEFFLSVNLVTADAIGLSLPEELLREAKLLYRE